RTSSCSGRANRRRNARPNDDGGHALASSWLQIHHTRGRSGHMRDDENLTAERATFVTHLACSASGARHGADELHNLSRERTPLLVPTDLAAAKKAWSRGARARGPRDLGRYRGLLPVRRARDIVSLGERVTPIMAMPRLAKTLKATEILVKDES